MFDDGESIGVPHRDAAEAHDTPHHSGTTVSDGENVPPHGAQGPLHANIAPSDGPHKPLVVTSKAATQAPVREPQTAATAHADSTGPGHGPATAAAPRSAARSFGERLDPVRTGRAGLDTLGELRGPLNSPTMAPAPRPGMLSRSRSMHSTSARTRRRSHSPAEEGMFPMDDVDDVDEVDEEVDAANKKSMFLNTHRNHPPTLGATSKRMAHGCMPSGSSARARQAANTRRAAAFAGSTAGGRVLFGAHSACSTPSGDPAGNAPGSSRGWAGEEDSSQRSVFQLKRSHSTFAGSAARFEAERMAPGSYVPSPSPTQDMAARQALMQQPQMDGMRRFFDEDDPEIASLPRFVGAASPNRSMSVRPSAMRPGAGSHAGVHFAHPGATTTTTTTSQPIDFFSEFTQVEDCDGGFSSDEEDTVKPVHCRTHVGGGSSIPSHLPDENGDSELAARADRADAEAARALPHTPSQPRNVPTSSRAGVRRSPDSAREASPAAKRRSMSTSSLGLVRANTMPAPRGFRERSSSVARVVPLPDARRMCPGGSLSAGASPVPSATGTPTAPLAVIEENNALNPIAMEAAARAAAAAQAALNDPWAQHEPLLPTVPEGEAGRKNVITRATLRQLLSGDYDACYDHIYVIDCRFPFEYAGGHICEAINICSPQELMRHFPLPQDAPQPRVCIVLHCEFSSHRAPRMWNLLRAEDRRVNPYPRLDFPEMYVLQGGYRTFFDTPDSPAFCDPPRYRRMHNPVYAEQLREARARYDRSWEEHTASQEENGGGTTTHGGRARGRRRSKSKSNFGGASNYKGD